MFIFYVLKFRFYNKQIQHKLQQVTKPWEIRWHKNISVANT